MKLKIKEVRTEKGVSLSKLARITNISKSYLSNLEDPVSKKKNPTLKIIFKIAEALNVRPCDLIECEYFIRRQECSDKE